MSGRWLFTLVACVAALAGGGLGAREDASLEVIIERPTPESAVLGELEIVARVLATEPLEVVRFYVDGRLKAEFQQPPFRARVDVGDLPAEHRVLVQARGVSGATASATVVTPRMHIAEELQVDLQQLYVTAVDRSGRPVLDLERSEFEVRVQDSRPSLVTFERGDVPFTAVVLLDGSASMAGEKLVAARRGAEVFARGMGELDEASLAVFSDSLRVATPFTTVPEVLLAGLGAVTAQGGTALHDVLYRACRQLERRQGRRVVVLLSDGIDSHSVLRAADLVEAVRRSQAILYWLHLPVADQSAVGSALPRLFSMWKDAAAYREDYDLLTRTVTSSGGRIIPVHSTREIAPAFQEILRELRQQYVLGFYPPAGIRGRGWTRISVRVTRPGVEARTAQGYLGS